jgi:RNA recognition motif-containing protein
MSKNIYVGNLSFSTTELDIAQLFAGFGKTTSVQLVMDRETGRSRGFAFVEMSTDSEAKQAIAGLDRTEMDGRELTVNEARPRQPKSGGGRPTRSRSENGYY